MKSDFYTDRDLWTSIPEIQLDWNAVKEKALARRNEFSPKRNGKCLILDASEYLDEMNSQIKLDLDRFNGGQPVVSAASLVLQEDPDIPGHNHAPHIDPSRDTTFNVLLHDDTDCVTEWIFDDDSRYQCVYDPNTITAFNAQILHSATLQRVGTRLMLNCSVRISYERLMWLYREGALFRSWE